LEILLESRVGGFEMRNLNLIAATFAVGTILGIGVASAADLPVKMLAPVAAPFSWTGFYIGGSAGGGVMLGQGYTSDIFNTVASGSPSDRHGVGALAGGQLGYNYQIGMLVLGIEGEGFWSGMKETPDTFALAVFGGNTLVSSSTIKNKWDYDVAARFGLAIDHALIYGKAGWVAGGFSWSTNYITNPTFQNYGSSTLNGLLIGVGLEYAVTNNWTVKFEYDYLGFGAKDVPFNAAIGAAPFNYTQSVSADKNIFKVGLNYLFNAAPASVARY
jgi:outer membrane immunogenic protein